MLKVERRHTCSRLHRFTCLRILRRHTEKRIVHDLFQMYVKLKITESEYVPLTGSEDDITVV